jgi:hypothetical protein
VVGSGQKSTGKGLFSFPFGWQKAVRSVLCISAQQN